MQLTQHTCATEPASLVQEGMKLNLVALDQHHPSTALHIALVCVFARRGRPDERDPVEGIVYPFQDGFWLRMRCEQQGKRG